MARRSSPMYFRISTMSLTLARTRRCQPDLWGSPAQKKKETNFDGNFKGFMVILWAFNVILDDSLRKFQ